MDPAVFQVYRDTDCFLYLSLNLCIIIQFPGVTQQQQEFIWFVPGNQSAAPNKTRTRISVSLEQLLTRLMNQENNSMASPDYFSLQAGHLPEFEA